MTSATAWLSQTCSHWHAELESYAPTELYSLRSLTELSTAKWIGLSAESLGH